MVTFISAKAIIFSPLGDYTKAIQLNPNFAATYVNLGVAYRTLGQFDLAIESYTTMIGLAPNDVDASEAYNNRGLVYFHKSNFDLAMQDFNRAIKLQPKLVTAYVNRAAAYLSKNEFNLAIENYTKVIGLNPELAMAYYARGAAWLHLREWEKAKADIASAKDKGLDIIAAFQNTYRSVAVFKQRYGIQLPPDIVVMLTQQ